LEAVARELRERDALMGDVIAWVRDERQQELKEASAETTLIRLLGGLTGRNMSLVWALNDYVPADGGPPLMMRYTERPGLDPSSYEIARGLTEARLEVYRVSAVVPGLWVEIEPLAGGRSLRLPAQDGLERLQTGEILVARMVTATTMPTPWGVCARFAADSERRWRARMAALPADPARAALIVLGFQPEDAAEPLPDRLQLHSVAWRVDDDDAVCETLEAEDSWECIGQAIPSGWAFSRPDDAASETLDLGGWRKVDGEIEIARLIVCEREMTLVSADHQTMIELAALLEESLRGLIASRPGALAA